MPLGIFDATVKALAMDGAGVFYAAGSQRLESRRDSGHQGDLFVLPNYPRREFEENQFALSSPTSSTQKSRGPAP